MLSINVTGCIQRMMEGNIFALFTPLWGYPIQLMGIPTFLHDGGSTPSSSHEETSSFLIGYTLGYPHCDWMGYPPPSGPNGVTKPPPITRQSSRASTCCVTGSMAVLLSIIFVKNVPISL